MDWDLVSRAADVIGILTSLSFFAGGVTWAIKNKLLIQALTGNDDSEGFYSALKSLLVALLGSILWAILGALLGVAYVLVVTAIALALGGGVTANETALVQWALLGGVLALLSRLTIFPIYQFLKKQVWGKSRPKE